MSVRVRFPTRLLDLSTNDRALLEQFAAQRDDAAFAALVRRHGSMVLGLCRRAVRDAHLAEDAFQAVFLVLARNPVAAIQATSVGGWLFGVARRVGLAAKRHERRRERRKRLAVPSHADERPPCNADWDDLLRVLDEELATLPDECRAALLACFYQEKTQDEAAQQLGWSLSTLRRRLDRGKELLRARLTRRGATLSIGLFAGGLAPSTASATPPHLATAAVGTALGHTSIPPLVNVLAAGALGRSATGKFGAIAAALILGGAAAGFARPDDSTLPGPLPVAQPTAAAKGIEPAQGVAVSVPRQGWVTVTGRVAFPRDRQVPKPREITRNDPLVKTADCCFEGGKRLFFENILIEPEARGIRNAVVWLRPDSEDRKAAFPAQKIHPRLATRPREHAIDVVDCQFSPRVTVARVGDTLQFNNADALATNVNYRKPSGGVGSPAIGFNVLLAARTGRYRPDAPLTASRGAPDHFRSDIYRWMEGYVWTFDHPYSAVTDKDGHFSIPHAPVGAWRLAVWHEQAGYRNRQAGRQFGEQIVLTETPQGTVNLQTIVLESDGWNEHQ